MARFNPLEGALETDAVSSTPRKPRRTTAAAKTAAPKTPKVAPAKAAAPARTAARYTVDVRTLPLATFACLTNNPDTDFNTERRAAFANYCDAHPEHAPDWRTAWRAFAELPPFPTDAGRPTNVETLPPPVAIAPSNDSAARHARLTAAMRTLSDFMGRRQTAAVRELMRGEEKDFFIDRMIELAGMIDTMPKTYDQDGKGEEAIVWLHYFAGGSANWWIIEKDKGAPGEREQHQAFGLANFYGGANDPDAELGYISIVELLANGAELDFHFAPRTLRELTARRKPAPFSGSESAPEIAVHVPRSAAEEARGFILSL